MVAQWTSWQPHTQLWRHLQRVIEETVSKVREEEEVVEGDDGEGIPYDPNPVCPKWLSKCIFSVFVV